MSADRYEITDNDASIRCQKPGKGPLILYACDRDSSTQKIIAVIRQLRADLAAVSAERDRLRDDNAALLAANRDCKDHFDALKGDYDEAAHFARHFIRDDPNITPRGAIIRLGDKCTDLFVRLQTAETERDEWITCHAQLFRKLGNLLAVIHRDGGHYQSEHGIDKAIEDAQQRICDTHAGLGASDELAMLVRRLARALQKASPEETDDALTALAELERAASEPVATVCLITDRFAHNHCIEAQLQIDPGAQLPIGTKLYAAPPIIQERTK